MTLVRSTLTALALAATLAPAANADQMVIMRDGVATVATGNFDMNAMMEANRAGGAAAMTAMLGARPDATQLNIETLTASPAAGVSAEAAIADIMGDVMDRHTDLAGVDLPDVVVPEVAVATATPCRQMSAFRAFFVALFGGSTGCAVD